MVFAVCAALRLARFNVQTAPDEASHDWFQGLPSPAAAGQVVALVILDQHLHSRFGITALPRVLPTVVFFMGVLMVSRVRYPHLVSRFLSGQHAFAELAFVAIVVLLLATHKELTLAGGFSLYTAAGIVGVVHHAVFHTAEEEKPIF
jgi:CDP-diacylglycerol--serine O-phosphatidyltransferase